MTNLSLALRLNLLFAILIAGIFYSSSARASDPFCEKEAEYAEFDFWVGDWEVYSGDNYELLVGWNLIEKLAAGCLISESWTNSSNGKGYSYRFFDPHEGNWKMLWVANGYSVEAKGGRQNENEILMEGTIHYFASEMITGFRVRFTNNGDGTVRQFAEQYDSKRDQWDVWFDGQYRRP